MAAAEHRLLEDGSLRLLEDGTNHRILEQSAGTDHGGGGGGAFTGTVSKAKRLVPRLQRRRR